MLRTVIILFFIALSFEWIVGIEMDGRGRRNKTELRTNKRKQEQRGFDNLHTNTNKLNRAEERKVAQPLRCLHKYLDNFEFLQSWKVFDYIFIGIDNSARLNFKSLC